MMSVYRDEENPLFQYVLGLGDDALILGHRWSEWLSNGPNLELDIAASNLALDLVGQADLFLSYAGEVEGKGRTADDLAYLRDTQDFRCHWLCEQPNEDWGVSMVRMLMFSVYQYQRLTELLKSTDKRLVEIAEKALKEVTYHRRFSADWLVRLSQGTDEGHRRVQNGLDILWRFVPELFETSAGEQALADKNIAVASHSLEAQWRETMDEVMREAGVSAPETSGRIMASRHDGHHSEHLGHLLCEMQFLQRAYPKETGAVW